MNVWFEAAQAKFEVFLEAKFDLYGDSASCVADGAEGAFIGNNLHSLPDEFLDDADATLQKVYVDLPDGFAMDEVEERGCVSSALYGELTPRGVRQLVAFMREAGATTSVRGASFVDMGSGTGKVVLDVALLCPELSRAIGVEFVASRHDVGQVALRTLASSKPDCASRVELVCGDFMKLPADTSAITAAFCCGVGFTEDFCAQICDRLSTFSALRVCVLLFKSPPSHCFLLPADTAGKGRRKTVQVVNIDTTWMSNAPAFLIRFE